MAIEEPEAHLHPHLQRLIFGRLLATDKIPNTLLVTTQSPHIASVADPQSLLLLRTVNGTTEAAAANTASLQPSEWADIARYLDATRAELVFARRVLLVEGFAEQVLIPGFARKLGFDLDKLGISVCAIHGTHFSSYARFCSALGIPWAIITDGDEADEAGSNAGLNRAAKILRTLKLEGSPQLHGIFVGKNTFEYDLLSDKDNVPGCLGVLKELCGFPSQEKIDSWFNELPTCQDLIAMLKNAGGKGRYAQRLVMRNVSPPDYVTAAIRYLERQ
jgi:putative ATP-dependent endonuclease of OLD family